MSWWQHYFVSYSFADGGCYVFLFVGSSIGWTEVVSLISFEWEVCRVSFEIETFSTGHRSGTKCLLSTHESRFPLCARNLVVLSERIKTPTRDSSEKHVHWKQKEFRSNFQLVLFDSPNIQARAELRIEEHLLHTIPTESIAFGIILRGDSHLRKLDSIWNADSLCCFYLDSWWKGIVNSGTR